MNPYYNSSPNPTNRSTLSSSLIRTEFLSIQAAFNLLPVVSGNANKLVVVDPTGAFLTVVFSGVYGGGNITTNTAYGLNALVAVTTAYDSSAFGSNALAGNVAGPNNSAFGARALQNNGKAVVAGTFALSAQYVIVTVGTTDFTLIGSADNNVGTLFITTGVGAGTGTAAPVVSGNSAFGTAALNTTNRGGSNSAFGGNSLQYTTSFGNSAFGAASGSNVSTGSNNSIFGNNSGTLLTTGSNNAFFGVAVGATIDTGSNNTLIGGYADTIAAASNSTALGYQAVCTASNEMVLGNASVTKIRGMGDNVTDLGDATHRLKDGYFAGQVKGGAGTGTGQPVMVGTLSVNTTAVGNVGAGTDDLMTYTLPANSLSANNKGVRVTVWGSSANNANAKSLVVQFGGATLTTMALPTTAAGEWRASGEILRTGANAQIYSLATFIRSSAVVTAANLAHFVGVETDTAAIIIKCTGAATADNDIVQKGMIVEFLN